MLGDGEVHVWWATPGFATTAALAWLSDGERARHQALQRAEDRERFRTGCALIRMAVAGYLGAAPADVVVQRACVDCGRPHGKPRVGGGLEISLSHSGERVVLAVARAHPVGVDVEQVRAGLDVRGLARGVLAAAEQQRLAQVGEAERLEAFLRYWTRKEAVVKATGAGLRTPLSSVEVAPPGEPARLVRGPAAAEGAHLFDLRPGAGYVAALAVLGATGWRVTEAPATSLPAV